MISQDPSLRLELPGLNLEHPLILSSGILGGSPRLLLRAQELGAAAAVTKSLTKHPIPGYDGPRVLESHLGILNALGIPNPGFESYLHEISAILPELKIPVICSIAGSDLDELIWIATRIDPRIFSGLELNLSCPHMPGYGAEMGSHPDQLEHLISQLKPHARVPIWVKLPPLFPIIHKLGAAAQDAGADGLVATNTLGGMQIDIRFRMPSLGAKLGGISGPSLKPIALRCVYQLYQSTQIPVMGSGGIQSWRDALEFLMAGASGIQIGSGLIKNTRIFHQIKLGLLIFMQQHGFTKIQEIIGLAHA